MSTTLEQIVEAYPRAPFDWLALSMNPAISYAFISMHRSLPWNIAAVSRNPGVTEETVRANLEFPWSYRDLCANPNITLQFMIQYAIKPSGRVDLDWNALSRNPMITMDNIERHPSYPWSDRHISANPNVSSNYVLTTGQERAWDFNYLSANPGITERDIYKNVLPWNHITLSSNPHLPAKYVCDNPLYAWNMHSVSTNANITMTDVDTFHSIKWDYSGLSTNPNITMQYVLRTRERPWRPQLLLINPSITLDDVASNMEYFSECDVVPQLCSNPTITTEWIQKNERLIHWGRLSRNHFRAMAYVGPTIQL